MLKPHGYAILIDQDKGVREFDCAKCAHCGKITHLKAFQRATDLGWCMNCNKAICQRCANKPCLPEEKMIEEWEKIGNMILSGGR